MARDLDLLTQRLAESREAIVRLLTAEAADKDVVVEEPPLGPRLLPAPLSAPEPAEPEPEAEPGAEGLVEDEEAGGEVAGDAVEICRTKALLRPRAVPVPLRRAGAYWPWSWSLWGRLSC